MKKNNYNKYGEYTGKKIITKKHIEKFYVVVSKDEPRKIINIYRFSKFEIQE